MKRKIIKLDDGSEMLCSLDGTRLEAVRKAAGLTQQQLADRIGVTRAAVGLWESEEVFPRPDQIKGLESVFGARELAELGAFAKEGVPL